MKKLEKLQLTNYVELDASEMKKVKGGYDGVCTVYCYHMEEFPLTISDCYAYIINAACNSEYAAYNSRCECVPW